MILSTFALGSVTAATYYASPNGSGDGSSYSTPTTFSAGLAKLKNPGDTLYLLSGQYDLGNTIVQNLHGSSSRRIVISGYEGMNEQGSYSAILDFRTTPYGTRGLQVKSSVSYLHIKNLTLRYSGKNNLHNSGTYCLFENLDIYGSADTGCQMKGDDTGNSGHSNIIKNVDSHDNFDYKTTGTGGVANFGGNADGFADKQFTGAGNHYIGCRAWNNSDDGWDFFQRVSNSNTIIENCICYQNGPAYYNMSQNPRATGVDKAWFDSKVGTEMTDRYGNIITITLDRYPCQGNGNGFKMGGAGKNPDGTAAPTNHKILIHHCLAVANNARGFDQNNNGGTMWVYNNTGYDNGYNFGFTTAYGTNYMQNNVSLSGKNADQPNSKTVAANDHNTWNSGFACSSADFQSLDTTQILAPRAADNSLAEGTCLRLASGSNLIDAGIDINLGYNGYAPDLGCYETPGEHHDPEPETPEETYPTEQPEGTHAVAFVTLPGSAADKPLLKYLRANDSLWVAETDATDNTEDYSGYEVIVLGSVPKSNAVGFAPLKGYDKPMVLLKPFLLKTGVWDWGTAVNTADLSIAVTDASHPLFEGVTITDGKAQLFAQCATNAVTAISTWTNTEGFTVLASPESQADNTSVAYFPAGTNCNGTTLPQPMYMIGVSEYSTIYLTTDGKRLIENAICLLLGIQNNHPQGIEQIVNRNSSNHKFIKDGKLYIQAGGMLFDATGRRISR